MPQIIPFNVQESPQTVPLGTEQVRRGIDGITPDIQIGTVTTLPAGSDATASITGTKEEPLLNLGIPQGEAGEVSQEEFDALEEAFEDLRDYVYDMSPLATVTAPVVAVKDAAPLNAENVTVAVEPKQDLHGYANPWPAGGGKNKLDISSFTSTSYGGVTYTKQADGGIKIYGQIDTAASIYIVNNVSIVLPAGTYTLTGTGKSEVYAYLLPGYKGGTFTLTEETTFTALQIRQDTVGYNANFVWYPQLEVGNSPTSFAPYSNICPITGWTGANVYHEDEYDAEADPAITVSWQSTAGTVYGGTLDVTRGKLTVDRAMVTIGSPNMSWSYNTTYKFFLTESLTNRKTETLAMISDTYKTEGGSWSGTPKNNVIWGNNVNNTLYIQAPDYTDASTFVSEMGNVQIVYELATPTTYDLDPTVISMLRGANTLWSDTGDTTLTYRQDVALVLQALTAPDETDMRANTNYAVNSFFTVGGQLYKATSAIATGETIRPGSNCTATTIAEQLTYLYSQI